MAGAIPDTDERHRVGHAASVHALLADACSLPLPATASLEHAHRRLKSLIERLEQGRLQLAVVGQFKRGKSTLLNALLGAPVLPSAITPLTAIPTFVRDGDEIGIDIEKIDGSHECLPVHSVSALHELLKARVTEDGNPENRLGLARVDVTYPNALLKTGIVLLDTPGVGSTYRHNTETARDTLPECDAALFVVSPDPPITETEIRYLKDVRAVTPSILVVLNKIDLVDAEDRARSEDFLARAVAQAIGDDTAGFFSLSARAALEAKRTGDAGKLAESGLPTLEAYLSNFAGTKRRAVLETAITRKAAALLREMAFEIELRLAACRMTIADLSVRLEKFEAADRAFARERDVRHDLLMGDRRRLLAELEARSARLRERMQASLHREIDALLVKTEIREGEIREQLADRIPRLFEAEFGMFETAARTTLESFLLRHQSRADEMIAEVRKAAAALFDVSFRAPEAGEAFQAKRVPYWVTASRESLTDAPAGLLDSLVPDAVRRRRLHNRLALQADEIVARNVENLRWAIRQNLEDAIRSFQAALDERLRLSQEAIRQAIGDGLKHRTLAEADSKSEIDGLSQVHVRLTHIADTLEGRG